MIQYYVDSIVCIKQLITNQQYFKWEIMCRPGNLSYKIILFIKKQLLWLQYIVYCKVNVTIQGK